VEGLLQRLRATGLWGLDLVKGGERKKAYCGLRAFDAMDSTCPAIQEHQREALHNLLLHAITTTRFYQEMRGDNLAEFPVVDKNIIRARQDDFMSNKYDKRTLTWITTSGSTGTPFMVYRNAEKVCRVSAEVLYYNEKAGYRFGANWIKLRALSKPSHRATLKERIKPEKVVGISRIDDAHIERLLHTVQGITQRASIIVAYASTYDALRDYFRTNGAMPSADMRIAGMVSTSEMLFDDTRDTMEKVFHCRCFSRYSNQENGIIGQDSMNRNVFILNEAHYIIEVLKMDRNEPAHDGEIGRIVITDLYNYAMPMIRYDTGDIGSLAYVREGGVTKKAISDFAGRRVDAVFDTHANRLSPHSITNTMWLFPEIRQFQFIQEDNKNYTMRLNINEPFKRQEELRTQLQKLLGSDAKVIFEVVEEIPVLASGKRKYIVNKMEVSNSLISS